MESHNIVLFHRNLFLKLRPFERLNYEIASEDPSCVYRFTKKPNPFLNFSQETIQINDFQLYPIVQELQFKYPIPSDIWSCNDRIKLNAHWLMLFENYYFIEKYTNYTRYILLDDVDTTFPTRLFGNKCNAIRPLLRMMWINAQNNHHALNPLKRLLLQYVSMVTLQYYLVVRGQFANAIGDINTGIQNESLPPSIFALYHRWDLKNGCFTKDWNPQTILQFAKTYDFVSLIHNVLKTELANFDLFIQEDQNRFHVPHPVNFNLHSTDINQWVQGKLFSSKNSLFRQCRFVQIPIKDYSEVLDRHHGINNTCESRSLVKQIHIRHPKSANHPILLTYVFEGRDCLRNDADRANWQIKAHSSALQLFKCQIPFFYAHFYFNNLQPITKFELFDPEHYVSLDSRAAKIFATNWSILILMQAARIADEKMYDEALSTIRCQIPERDFPNLTSIHHNEMKKLSPIRLRYAYCHYNYQNYTPVKRALHTINSLPEYFLSFIHPLTMIVILNKKVRIDELFKIDDHSHCFSSQHCHVQSFQNLVADHLVHLDQQSQSDQNTVESINVAYQPTTYDENPGRYLIHHFQLQKPKFDESVPPIYKAENNFILFVLWTMIAHIQSEQKALSLIYQTLLLIEPSYKFFSFHEADTTPESFLVIMQQLEFELYKPISSQMTELSNEIANIGDYKLVWQQQFRTDDQIATIVNISKEQCNYLQLLSNEQQNIVQMWLSTFLSPHYIKKSKFNHFNQVIAQMQDQFPNLHVVLHTLINDISSNKVQNELTVAVDLNTRLTTPKIMGHALNFIYNHLHQLFQYCDHAPEYKIISQVANDSSMQSSNQLIVAVDCHEERHLQAMIKGFQFMCKYHANFSIEQIVEKYSQQLFVNCPIYSCEPYKILAQLLLVNYSQKRQSQLLLKAYVLKYQFKPLPQRSNQLTVHGYQTIEPNLSPQQLLNHDIASLLANKAPHCIAIQ